MSTYKVLTEEQVQSFLDNGYLVVKDCFDREFATQWTDHAFERLGYDANDRSTWEKEIIWMDHAFQRPVAEISQKAWDAICDVVGGAARIEDKVMRLVSSGHFTTVNSREWSDSFIVNLKRGENEAWVPPSPTSGGWHKDGSYFNHFIDSREQALLTIVLWSDIDHKGGGTFIAPDSVRRVARYLRDHPEGGERGFAQKLIQQCEEFVEVTGETGDFIILHPFMIHSSSHNHSGRPRFMTNPPVVLKEPMNLNRENADEFSLLERATLHYLGLDRLDFRRTAPREERWTIVA
ncbi:MAG: phytanoyl-CoA dioxygenase family protein [Chloroflexota bacterium]